MIQINDAPAAFLVKGEMSIGPMVPRHKLMPVLTVLVLLPLGMRSPVSAQEAWVVGDITTSSCGSYIQATDDERKARPPGDASNAIYNLIYQAYLGAAEGFLSGANATDPVHRFARQGTDTQGRMTWLENCCRARPLDVFSTALWAFRSELLQKSEH